MPNIEVLDPHVADLIAAGEVVERPASAVKEMMENSIDAGAKNITVEIRGGGASLIRVTDDGSGMGIEDAATAFLRHATSKLKTARDLEAIGTLGFRGEALAAIAAVSRVTLLTRRESDIEGVSVRLEAGVLDDVSPAGAPAGTTISVGSLFFNTPARQKFLKSDRAEAAACYQAALRVALGRPDISVRFIRDGEEDFFTPGDGLPLSCIYSLFGRDFAMGLAQAEGGDEAVLVKGFVSKPGVFRGNRAHQFFFVNGRPIRSPRLQAALEQAYKNRLMAGRFPSCVLNITVNPAAVDVNVHPAKLEVKFSDERRVCNAVYYAALGAGSPAPPEDDPALSQKTAAAERSAETTGIFTAPKADSASAGMTAPLQIDSAQTEIAVTPKADTARAEITVPASAQTGRDLFRDAAFVEYRVSEPAKAPPPEDEPVPAPPAMKKTPDFRIAGEVMGTYIIADTGKDLVLIDKHAAHERLIFDRLRSGQYEPMPQMLIAPVTMEMGAGELRALMDSAAELERLGFELEPFGRNCVILRAVPSDTFAEDARALIEEIVERLDSGRGTEDMRDGVLRSIACKAAVKAGKSSEPAEAAALVEAVLSGAVECCPHGRPVSVTLTKKEIDKLFGRLG